MRLEPNYGDVWRALVLVAFLAGCAQEPSQSGAEGRVWLGPTCPVERDPPDPDCADRPFATDLIATGSGHSVPFRSSEDGAFRVALAPGTYTIHGKSTGTPPTCQSATFEVVAHAYTTVEVYCDSGIR